MSLSRKCQRGILIAINVKWCWRQNLRRHNIKNNIFSGLSFFSMTCLSTGRPKVCQWLTLKFYFSGKLTLEWQHKNSVDEIRAKVECSQKSFPVGLWCNKETLTGGIKTESCTTPEFHISRGTFQIFHDSFGNHDFPLKFYRQLCMRRVYIFK